ncbi:MAG: dihydroorotate dehydrogenase electron transfer subunit [Spirochaetes bacterium]|nr:dihydroorotate dehydrogenase electron transfer subunit [Spirochaetota bacterium]
MIENFIETSYPLFKIEGNSKQKTLYFKIGKKDIFPGQFYMLQHKSGQKPISVSYYDYDIIGFTIEDRGGCSNQMINSKPGDYFGLTGPLGTFFKIDAIKYPLLIGGGIGTAPIFFLANHLSKLNIQTDVFFGARSREFLDYTFEMKNKKNINLNIYTDDGSEGKKGFVTKDIDDHFEKEYDSLFMCGPEVMMKIVLDKVKHIIDNVQISMERYMKCGVGLCGTCVLDDIGLRVCTEGPVFDSKVIEISREFGVYHRDKNGIIKKL